MSNFYIYKIVNKITNKLYIGKTNDPERRWQKHIYTSTYGEKKYGFSYIHAAIKKYGITNFSFEIIDTCENEEDIFKKEIYWIEFYKTNVNKYGHEFGYNLTDGGEGPSGRIQSQEEKDKRSKSLKGKYVGPNSKMFGRKLSSETKQKISNGNMGKTMSESSKSKISEANSGENNGMYGKSESLEHRLSRGKKISETKRKNNNASQTFSPETIEKLKIAVREKRSQNLTDEQKDQIILLYNSGLYIKRELAAQFNVEEDVIKYVIRYWEDVKKNKDKYLTNEQKSTIVDLYLQKNTKKTISEITNIPFNRIEAVIKMYRNKNRNA